MTSTMPCPVCSVHSEYISKWDPNRYVIDCPRCGHFIIDESLDELVYYDGLSESQRACISGALREGLLSYVNEKVVDDFTRMKPPSFHIRADKLLKYLERETSLLGQSVKYTDTWISAAWCVNIEELNKLLDFLDETKRTYGVFSSQGYEQLTIRAEGWAHLEKLKSVNQEKDQGFVAMWFADDMQEIYDKAISPAIENAGYTPFRVDQGEHNGKIDDEIISQIRKSRFVLADFTGHRGGVYYEAGFAHGSGLDVIFTCRDDEMDKLHFDIRQYNCILWSKDDLPSFQDKITKRIEAVMGEGHHKKYS